METKEAIEKVINVFDCHENDRACNKEDRINIQKDKEGIISLLEKREKYPEIERIFIDFSVYINHRIKARKSNLLQDRYLDGYKQCHEDIRNKIRKLIESKTNQGGKKKKSRKFKCKKCGTIFYVPGDATIVRCPCGNTGYSE